MVVFKTKQTTTGFSAIEPEHLMGICKLLNDLL
jgi:hypothetical protein